MQIYRLYTTLVICIIFSTNSYSQDYKKSYIIHLNYYFAGFSGNGFVIIDSNQVNYDFFENLYPLFMDLDEFVIFGCCDTTTGCKELDNRYRYYHILDSLKSEKLYDSEYDRQGLWRKTRVFIRPKKKLAREMKIYTKDNVGFLIVYIWKIMANYCTCDGNKDQVIGFADHLSSPKDDYACLKDFTSIEKPKRKEAILIRDKLSEIINEKGAFIR